MEFRTTIDIPVSDLRIDHQSNLMMFGSCFAQNIGQLAESSKFNVNVNPFGILYNPLSVSNVIRRIVNGTLLTNEELKQCNGIYTSFMHHGDFSALQADEALSKMNTSLLSATDDLRKMNILVVTFGTAYVYRLNETGEVVSNCHKFPASDFVRSRLSVDEVVNDWQNLIPELMQINPSLNIIFTVSPIRHWKDGAHENQLSKSTLLLAIDALSKQYDQIHYFPSYEILMDELRDYRFYAEDMMHPSQTAINYIWDLFANTYFDEKTRSVIRLWNGIHQALQHRPFNPDAESYKQFLRQTLLKLEAFQDNYPYLNCGEEIQSLKSQLLQN